MARAAWETGMLLDAFVYIRLGTGPYTLLVIPGTTFDLPLNQVDESTPGEALHVVTDSPG